MLNLLVKVIFFIVAKIGDIVMAPIMLVISSVLPSSIDFFSNIFQFLGNGFSYMVFFLKSLLVPSACVNVVLFVFTAYITLQTGVRAYNLIVKIYDRFKP